MQLLELFFDYACPYCMRAHTYLTELMPEFPQLEIKWQPCEAHPRPDRYGPHSDLMIQGMFFAQKQGADLWEYHQRMYRAALVDHIDVEDANTLAICVDGLLDVSSFTQALKNGTHLAQLTTANHYAYQQSGVWVVPAYRTHGKKLDPIENVGISKKQLRQFIESAL